MNPDQWSEVEKLYHAALEHEPSERGVFLGQCPDEEVRREVQSLLDHEQEGDELLENPRWRPNLSGPSLAAGTRLGPYEILELIGAGGMGEVYRARDTKLGRNIALKVLPEERLADAQSQQRLIREARAASALNHPNIVTVHEIGSENGVDFIAMEFVEGKSLKELIPAKGLPLGKVLDCAVQIASGLAKAHAAGIIHRDLKPGNIMVTSDGVVKLLDFGLARRVRRAESETASLTQESEIAGTPAYMSPEQARGEELDARSDLFSFGVVLYEMATGHPAFPGSTSALIFDAILHKAPTSPVRLNPELPPKLEEIINKALEKDRDLRYQSASDMRADLKRLKRDTDSRRAAAVAPVSAPVSREVEGVLAPVPHTRERPQGAPLRKWWIAMAACGAVLAVIAILAALNVGGWRDRVPGRAGTPRIDSLAVLPLANLSGDPEQEYFADGMTEALIAELGQIGSLRVISRTSAMRYKKTDKPLPQIARDLNVDALIEGSVLRSGDRVRITAQLIGAVPERHLWARSYERDLRDILTLQGEVARAIADEVKANVTSDVQARLAIARPVNPESYELYLQGRYHAGKQTFEGFRNGIEYFQRAIEKDPGNALAYAGVAHCYAYMGGGFAYIPTKDALPKARAAALKALEIDDTLAEAHASLAVIMWQQEWDWSGAERELKRAVELNANSAEVHDSFRSYLAGVGRLDQALAEGRLAQQLDPFGPDIVGGVGWAYMINRHYDEALPHLQKGLELDPNLPWVRTNLAQTYAFMGRHTEALAECEKLEQYADPAEHQLEAGEVGYVYAVSGKAAEARRILGGFEKVAKTRYVEAYKVAEVYAGLGEKDQAFEWLQRAYREHSGSMWMIKMYPIWDPLRPDPRFQDLLRRMNFPP